MRVARLGARYVLRGSASLANPEGYDEAAVAFEENFGIEFPSLDDPRGEVALALDEGWLPPTVNLATPDASCDLDYIPGDGRTERPEYALSNSFGFGGINASVVLRRAS